MRTGLVFLVITSAFAVLASSAPAGHEAVSEALLTENVFLPGEPEVCPQLERELVKFTEQAAAADYPIYVAIIGSAADIGGAAQYFGQPQPYAELLGSEIGISPDLESSRSLLVVMSVGYGYKRSGRAPDVSEVVHGLSAPESGEPDDLAQAAIAALPKLARAAGKRVPGPGTAGCSSDGGSSPIVFILPAALVLLAAAVVGFVVHRRASFRRGD